MSIRLLEDKTEEENCDIILRFSCTSGHGRYLVDSYITPGYCTNCNKQISGFFEYSNSRYGQVGEIYCNHCDAIVYCTDDDNVKHRIFMSTDENYNRFIYSVKHFDRKLRKTVIEFEKIFLLTPDIIEKVKLKTNYDICIKNEDISLKQIIHNIIQKLNIDIDDIENEQVVVDSRFDVLPDIVEKWFGVLKYIEVI